MDIVKRLIVAITLITFSGFAFAEQSDYPITGKPAANMEKFDKAFVSLLKTWHIPGAAVAIMKDNKLIFSRGYGYADLETKAPVQPDALFRIASISKAITAVAIMKLVEENRLSLDSKAFTILDDVKPIKSWHKPHPRIKDITVKQLLQMTSGWIPNGKFHFDPTYGPWSGDLVKLVGFNNLPASCFMTTRMMLSRPVRNKPGSAFSYSNLDYCVLGLIIDKVNNAKYDYQGYQDYINQHLFKPLGITDMQIAATDPEQQNPKEVKYYRYQGPIDISYQGVYKHLPYAKTQLLKKNFSNGGWLASAPDLVKFVSALANGKILKPETLQTMLQRPAYHKENAARYFGMGWKVKYKKDKRIWYATGSFTGTNALVIRTSKGSSAAFIFNARPPIYHMWKDFRPKLKQLINAKQSRTIEQTLEMMMA